MSSVGFYFNSLTSSGSKKITVFSLGNLNFPSYFTCWFPRMVHLPPRHLAPSPKSIFLPCRLDQQSRLHPPLTMTTKTIDLLAPSQDLSIDLPSPSQDLSVDLLAPSQDISVDHRVPSHDTQALSPVENTHALSSFISWEGYSRAARSERQEPTGDRQQRVVC